MPQRIFVTWPWVDFITWPASSWEPESCKKIMCSDDMGLHTFVCPQFMTEVSTLLWNITWKLYNSKLCRCITKQPQIRMSCWYGKCEFKKAFDSLIFAGRMNLILFLFFVCFLHVIPFLNIGCIHINTSGLQQIPKRSCDSKAFIIL